MKDNIYEGTLVELQNAAKEGGRQEGEKQGEHRIPKRLIQLRYNKGDSASKIASLFAITEEEVNGYLGDK